MKRNVLLIGFVLLALAGCNSTGDSPKAVIEKFVLDAESGNVDAMNKAFSKRAIQEMGDKIKSLNKSYSDMIKETGAKEKASMVGTQEKITGDKALVSYNYGVSKNGSTITGKNTGCTAFELVKEDGSWKIDKSVDCP
ncbi:MAG TPA: hypothetical protein VIG62_13120 [Blastocatellia bacterium]|jgi:hypothetical protein